MFNILNLIGNTYQLFATICYVAEMLKEDGAISLTNVRRD